MATVFFAFIIMAVIMAAMAVGVLAGREPIKGSCGGLNKVGIEGKCELCGGDMTKCDSAETAPATTQDSLQPLKNERVDPPKPGKGAQFYNAAEQEQKSRR